MKNIRHMFFASAGRYVGTSKNDHGLTEIGQLQASNLAHIMLSLIGRGKQSVCIMYGNTKRMIQTATTFRLVLGGFTSLIDEFTPGYESHARGAMFKKVTRSDLNGINVIVIIAPDPALDNMVASLDLFCHDTISDLQLPRLGLDLGYGADVSQGVRSGQAWHVGVEEGYATIVGKDHSFSAGVPSELIGSWCKDWRKAKSS